MIVFIQIGLTQISYIPSAGVPLVKEDLLLGRKKQKMLCLKFVNVNNQVLYFVQVMFWKWEHYSAYLPKISQLSRDTWLN